MPPKRPREEEAAAVVVAVAAAAAGQEEEEEAIPTTPSKSVRLNLTGQESGGEAIEESKSLGAMIVVAESSSNAAAVGQRVVTPALVRLQLKRAAAAADDASTVAESSSTTTATTINDQPIEYESSSTSVGARRALFPMPAEAAASSTAATRAAVVDPPVATITPYSRKVVATTAKAVPVVVTAKRKLIFGRLVTETVVQENVQQVYRIIRKFTGGIGGNGSHGPIYGELTMGSMQKMVNLMKEHTGLSCSSRFIDVGSGIGKPNFHVAQDPGVEFSYGIEIEADRWLLGMSCLKQVLNIVASQQQQQQLEQQQQGAAVAPTSMPSNNLLLQHRVFFEHGDIRNAKTFDPFTHVYMFSIGFPPQLWITLSEIWNQSTSPFMICFHSPKDVIKNYEFDVDLVTQMPTSMHGSKEGHMGYIYRRCKKSATTATTRRGGVEGRGECCDPLFRSAQETVKCGLPVIKAKVDAKVEEKMNNNRTKRVPGGKKTAS